MPPPIQLDDDSEVKGDMTPMIDIIFLLLVFFILTTKFIPEEKMIASILPTNKGQSAAKQELEPPENFNILIYPHGEGYVRNSKASIYDRLWKEEGYSGDAVVRVANLNPIVVDGGDLSAKGAAQTNAELQKVHGYIQQELAGFEQSGKPRNEQDPVIIHCFSGLPWKFALAAYDAVRAYEAGIVGKKELTPEDLQNAREVTFAPPRIRDYHEWEMGKEIFEIIHME